MGSDSIKIRRALISVSDKSEIVEFARALAATGVEIVSTGGTARLLGDHRIDVQEVSELTGFPEMMDGRLKTLHPLVHGGILARRGRDDDALAAHGIQPIDLVVVNLYPFQQVTSRGDCDLHTAIENIDIGGPTMVRAAAKNYRDVTVVVDSGDYAQLVERMQTGRGIELAFRYRLARKAFEHTARYEAAIANYLGATDPDGTRHVFADTLNLQFRKVQSLRYGENPHQRAAFYGEHDASGNGIAAAKQLQGKELSYNNIADADAAIECVKQFEAPSCVIVKHANPCGAASADSILEAYDRAFATDPESAFGGIIAFNEALTPEVARRIVDGQFVEVIVAPDVAPAAVEVLSSKKNVRVLRAGPWVADESGYMDYKRVNGGLLVQDADRQLYERIEFVTARDAHGTERDDLLFAWKVAKYVKSNAIVFAKDLMTIGVGAGQMSRVNSARIAAIKAEHAGLEVKGSVMASDAFFPFRDAVDTAAAAGITAIIQPGGSMRDDEVVAACDEHGIAMAFTGMRHFRH